MDLKYGETFTTTVHVTVFDLLKKTAEEFEAEAKKILMDDLKADSGTMPADSEFTDLGLYISESGNEAVDFFWI